MRDASQASATVEHEARSHRRVAGGLGTRQGGGRRALAGTRHSARADARIDAPLGTICPRRTLKKTRLLPVSQERKWDPLRV